MIFILFFFLFQKLRDINDMISQHTRTPDTRRRLSMVDNEDGLGPSPPKRLPESNGLTRRLQELTKDRVPNHR